MKDKYISTLLIGILGIVFIGGAINHYSPDVCPQPPAPAPTNLYPNNPIA